MVVLFALTSFFTAFLLFLVQPLVGRLVLPAFGGSPQVWTTSMLFFQIALLVGYAYTHVATRRLEPRRQPWIHLLIASVPLVLLPITLDVAPSGRGGLTPSFELLAALLVGVAAPFVLVATSGPLVQRWFSWTDHRGASDPYFLFGAGNLGSAAGLIVYPSLVEPNLALPAQARLWSGGYVVAVALLAACAVAAHRWRFSIRAPADEAVASETSAVETSQPPGTRRAWTWVAYAFVPSSLMLGVTAHISTDVAAVPLLWVLPLGLYLLTFSVAFSRVGPGALRLARWAAVPVVVISLLVDPASFGTVMPIGAQLLLVVVGGLVGHGLLAADRPDPSQLTRFYLLVAAGGALGGVANALVAPVLFPTVMEHGLAASAVLLLVAVWLAQPSAAGSRWGGFSVAGGLTAAAVVGLVAYLFIADVVPVDPWLRGALLLTLGLVLLVPPARRGIVAITVVAVALLPQVQLITEADLVQRTFFGVHRVVDNEGRVLLYHGTTVHGTQNQRSQVERLRPAAYYHAEGPMGDLMQVHDDGDVGVLGLGTGGLAAYGRDGQTLYFHEIDPAVVDIAWSWFTYLDESQADVRIVLGDGRLTVADVPPGQYEWLIADAFSSDAIPIHLVTLEALEVYMAAVADEGSVVFNVSNRHVDLEPVLLGASEALGVPALYQEGDSPDGFRSAWVILSRDTDRLARLEEAGWRPLRGPAQLWTDQRSDLWSVIDRPTLP